MCVCVCDVMESSSSGLLGQHRVVVELFDEFEALFDHYASLTRNESHGQDEVTQRLRALRELISVRSLRLISRQFQQLLQHEPSLVRLDDLSLEYLCFGDLHGSLSDMALLRNTFWRDRTRLEQTHFVFLGLYYYNFDYVAPILIRLWISGSNLDNR